MTQPTERRFVMEPRLDAEVETINDALDLKVDLTDPRLTDERTPLDNSVTSAKIVNGTILGEDIDDATIESVNLAEQEYIKFDTTYTGGSTQPGEVAWNADQETLEFQLDPHVTLQIGQEHVMRIKNASGSVAIPNGTVVMFAGASGDTISVSPAVSDGTINVNYLAGITTEEIPADGFGFVTQLGFITNVNTNAYTVGTILYVDPATPGGLTATEPESPAWTMPVAAVTKQNTSSGRLLVRAIPGGSGAGGGASVNVSDTAPAGGNEGDLWLDSTDGTLYVYYEDVDGVQWIQVQANSALGASIESRLGALESQAIALGTYSPNYIINGAFDIWQRGTSFTANGYTADRWSATVSGTCTHSREASDIPAGARYAYKWTTGANSSFGQIRQFIETATVIPLRGKTLTASAFVKISSNFTGTLSFEIFSSSTTDTIVGFSGSALSQVATGTPNSSGYTRITATFTVPSNAVGLYVGIVPTQVQVSGAFALMANIQLEEGSTATSFRRNANSLQGELAACQRYYYQMGPQVTGSGQLYVGFALLQAPLTTVIVGRIQFPVKMRTTPTSVFWTGTTSNYAIYTGSGAISGSPGIGADRSSEDSVWISWPGSGFTSGGFYFLTANNSTAAYLGFSAEL